MSFMTLLDQRPIAVGGQGAAPPRVRIRPYESADGGLVAALSARLSKDSLYERFFTGTPELPPRYVAALTWTDHYDREVLLALSRGDIGDFGDIGGGDIDDFGGGDIVVGIAEYVRDAHTPDRADLAVLVADAWHRRGMARRLIGALAVLAAGRGIAYFGADALVTNHSALAAIARLWPAARAVRDGTTARFTLPVRAVLPPDSADLVPGAQQVLAGGDDASGHRGLRGLAV